MKKISVLLSILIPFFIQAQEAYTIQGELGMPTRGKIVLHWYNIVTGKHDDSADNVDGHFVIKGTTTDKTQLGQLIFHTDNTEKSVLFYLEPGTIHIHYAAGAEYAKLSGTPTNND